MGENVTTVKVVVQIEIKGRAEVKPEHAMSSIKECIEHPYPEWSENVTVKVVDIDARTGV